jgi:predicted DNA-binding transcriptional regulator AlpA
MRTPSEKLLIDTKALGILTGFSPRTLERKRVSGTGPAYVKVGKAVRYRPEDVQAWIANHLIASTSMDRGILDRGLRSKDGIVASPRCAEIRPKDR